jgi:hypothetical protein
MGLNMRKSLILLGAVVLTACGDEPANNNNNAPDLSDLLDAGPGPVADAGQAGQDTGVQPTPDAGEPAADTGGPEPTPDTGPPAPTPVAELFAMKAVSAILQRNPVAGRGEAQVVTTQYMLVDSERLADDFSWTESLCSISTSEARWNALVRARTSYPEAFVTHFPVQDRTATWTEGGEFNANNLTSVVGARLANPLTDPLPTEAGAAGEVDSDRDGNPGVTVNVAGAVSGSVYVAQRSIINLRGRERNDRRIEGLWESNDQQVVLGASNGILNRAVENRRDPDAARSFFIMVPIDDDWDCSDINANIDDLF